MPPYKTSEKFKKKWKNKRDEMRIKRKARIELPDGITCDMMSTYVWYHKEPCNNNKENFRECFQILNHPKYDKNVSYFPCQKIIRSSNSNKIEILEKLKHINEKLYNLENNIVTTYDHEINDPYLKPCFTIRPVYSWWVFWQGYQPHFIFDLSFNNQIFHLKMKIDPDKTRKEELERFKKKVWETFEGKFNMSVIL